MEFVLLSCQDTNPCSCKSSAVLTKLIFLLRFVQKSSLQAHHLLQHSHDASFVCGVCSRKFRTKDLRDSHQVFFRMGFEPTNVCFGSGARGSYSLLANINPACELLDIISLLHQCHQFLGRGGCLVISTFDCITQSSCVWFPLLPALFNENLSL